MIQGITQVRSRNDIENYIREKITDIVSILSAPTSRTLTDLSGIASGRNFRLTGFGLDFCSRLQRFSDL